MAPSSREQPKVKILGPAQVPSDKRHVARMEDLASLDREGTYKTWDRWKVFIENLQLFGGSGWGVRKLRQM